MGGIEERVDKATPGGKRTGCDTHSSGGGMIESSKVARWGVFWVRGPRARAVTVSGGEEYGLEIGEKTITVIMMPNKHRTQNRVKLGEQQTRPDGPTEKTEGEN